MSGNYSIMSFGQYWDDNNYNTKTNTNSGYDSYDYQDDTSVFATESYTTSPYGSIFGGDVDYSSSYDAIFDQFHKTLAEMQAQDDETSDGSDVTGSQGGQTGDGSDTQVGGSDGDLTGDNAYGDAAGSQGASGEVSGADGSGDNQGQQPQVELLRSEQVRGGFDADAIATSLHGASEPGIFGWGTNESVFEKYFDGTDSYTALNGAEMAAVAQAYEAKYGESLESMVRGEFSFSTEDKYVAKIKNSLEAVLEYDENGNVSGAKYVDDAASEDVLSEEFLKQMASKFYDATRGQWGTDEEAVWQVMNLDKDALKQVIEYYNNSPYADEMDFKTAIQKDFSFMSGEGKLIDIYNKAMGEE